MIRIDAHAHIIEHLAGFGGRGELRAIGGGRGRWANGEEMQVIPKGYGDYQFSPETLIGIMDNHGIDRAILLQGPLYGFQNEYVHEAVVRYPERFVGCGSFDPFCGQALDIMERLISKLEFRVLKFELSVFGGLMGYHADFSLTGSCMMPIWEACSEKGVTVVLDVGSPGTASYRIDELAEIVRAHPTLRCVIAHLLAPSPKSEGVWENAMRLLKSENVWFDLSALPWLIREKSPYHTIGLFLKKAKDIVGADHLIWGSDAPILTTIAPYSQLLNYVPQSDVFTESELDGICGGNAFNAYPIEVA